MSSIDETSPAFHHVSKNDHSPWIIATSSFLLIISVLVTGGKVISKWQIANFHMYDGLILAATAVAFVETICIILASNHGLGHHRDKLSDEEFDTFCKFYYAANILLIISLALAKVSSVLFNMAISPQTLFLRSCQGLLAIIGLWSLSGILALSFQCNLPSPWLIGEDRCVNQYALFVALHVVNIVTDFMLVMLPVIMVFNIQASLSRRWAVIALYLSRLIVPIITIFALATLKGVFPSDDPTWNAVTATIGFQVMLNVSLVTTCVLSLKRYLDTFRTGFLAKMGEGYDQFSKSPNDSKLKSFSSAAAGTSRLRGDNNWIGYNASSKQNKLERSESVKGLTDGVILQTLQYSVDYNSADNGDKRSPDEISTAPSLEDERRIRHSSTPSG